MSSINNAIRELEAQLKQIDSALKILRGLDGKGGGARTLSDEGRRRIAEAQKRRWAKVRAGKSKNVA